MSTQEKTAMMITLAADWRESGMTQVQYAQTNNLSVHTLKYWLYKGKRAKTSSFLQVSDLSYGTDFVIRYPHSVELKIPSVKPTATIRALINLYPYKTRSHREETPVACRASYPFTP